ncbi:MAG: helix-turn-helix domain-containing protein [Oscillospiraceae bacterium]
MKRPGQRKTFRTILMSYGAVLIIPILFGFVFSILSLHIVRREVSTAQQQLLSHIEENIDTMVVRMNSTASALYVDASVNAMAKRKAYSPPDYVTMRSIQREISLIMLSNHYIDDILFYFHSSDSILGRDLYYSSIGRVSTDLSLVGMDMVTLKEQLRSTSEQNVVMSSTSREGRDKMFLVYSNAATTIGGSPTVSIIIRLNTAAMDSQLYDPNATTILYSDGKNALVSPDTALPGPLSDILAAADKGNSYGDFILLSRHSDHPQLRYLRLIPKSLYSRNLDFMYLIMAAYFFICLAAGIPLALSMARRNYTPIQQLVRMIPNPAAGQDADDFLQIQNSLTALVQENKVNEETIDRQTSAMKLYLLHRALAEKESYLPEFRRECEKLGISMIHPDFAVMGFDIEDGSNLFFESREAVDDNVTKLIYFVIDNVMNDLIPPEYGRFTAEYDSMLYCVVNLPEGAAAQVLLLLRAAAQRLFELLRDDFCVTLSVSISGVHQGLGGLQRCREEIQAIIDLRTWQKVEQYVLQYSDLDQLRGDGRWEERLMLLVRGRSYDEAIELLQAQAARPAEEEPDSGGQEELIDRILEYIGSHYPEPDFSVSRIADHFSMTSSNLSLYFKRRMGMAPLEYIHMKRIERAKELLGGDMTVKDVAKAVGYVDTRPMIRFFKRFEKMSPAQYRSSLRNAGQ